MAGTLALGWMPAVFTLLTCLAAGLLAAQGIQQARGRWAELNIPVAAVALVAALCGVGAFVLTFGNPLSFFGGFRHPTTGIALLLYTGTAFAVMAVVSLVLAVRDEDHELPTWAAILDVIVAVLFMLGVAMGYLKTSWVQANGGTWLLFAVLLTSAFLMGALAVQGCAAAAGLGDGTGEGAEAAGADGLVRLVGVAAAVLAVLFGVLYVVWYTTSVDTTIAREAARSAFSMQSFSTAGAVTATTDAANAQLTAVLAEYGAMVWGGGMVAGMVLPLVCCALTLVPALAGKRGALAGVCLAGLVLALAGGLCLRLFLGLLAG